MTEPTLQKAYHMKSYVNRVLNPIDRFASACKPDFCSSFLSIAQGAGFTTRWKNWDDKERDLEMLMHMTTKKFTKYRCPSKDSTDLRESVMYKIIDKIWDRCRRRLRRYCTLYFKMTKTIPPSREKFYNMASVVIKTNLADYRRELEEQALAEHAYSNWYDDGPTTVIIVKPR